MTDGRMDDKVERHGDSWLERSPLSNYKKKPGLNSWGFYVEFVWFFSGYSSLGWLWLQGSLVIHVSEGRWFDPTPVQPTCVLRQDTEPQIASDAVGMCVVSHED